jgi:hypothetical protein
MAGAQAPQRLVGDVDGDHVRAGGRRRGGADGDVARRRGRRVRDTRLGGRRQPSLLRGFRSLDPLDLAADRGKELAALRELRFDALPLSRLLGDDLLLLSVRVRELCAVPQHGPLE